MQPDKRMAWASAVAFVVLCVLAWGTWEVQAHLNMLRAFEVPEEVVQTTIDDGVPFFHLKRDPSITRNEIEMARLDDEIFFAQLGTMIMGLAALVVPFFVMGKMGRGKP